MAEPMSETQGVGGGGGGEGRLNNNSIDSDSLWRILFLYHTEY